MKKGKIPGLNGMSIYFYTSFFEIIKDDLLKVVQESKCSRNILGDLNSMFLALIPPKMEVVSFEEYYPISCCKNMYKVISKIIENRLKPILSEIISKEQFGFLFKHQIHDAMILSQEVMHSIITSKIPSFLLKSYLTKSYDQVSWNFFS
jgi:hypothetical protein